MSPWKIRVGCPPLATDDDGVEEPTLIEAPRPARLAPGALAGAAALLATVGVARSLGSLVPLVGAPAFALLLGMALRLVYEPDAAARRVLRFSSRTVLQAAIVLLGATFGLGDVARVGRTSLPLMLATLAAALLAAVLVGRLLRVDRTLQTLVGVGTAICGASAIGAVAGIVGAAEVEIAYAISTIFVFNVVAVVLFPLLGHVLSLGQHTFGLWAGTAINDTSSVVAAGYTYGHAAGDVAVVTKLARTTMIVPIALGLAMLQVRGAGTGQRRPLRQLFPTFLLWFLLASALNSAGLVTPRMADGLARTASLFITVALAAIGLSSHVLELRRAGVRPLALGTVLWLVVAVSGLALQRVL
jgi:uncharacterized integral membrane protein (TIGR00698 family)